MARGNLALAVVLLATVGGSMAWIPSNAGTVGKPSSAALELLPKVVDLMRA